MDEPLFNELLESVKQADQIMTDHAELRRLAEACDVSRCADEGEERRRLHDFYDCVEPELILDLLDEIDRLKAENDRLRQGMKGDYDIDAWLDWSKEKEQIKAQNDALQGALHAVQAEVDGNLRPLTRDLDAYYYGFDPTGCDLVDSVLEQVARAGKAFHSTDDWNEEDLDGLSPVDKMQAAANASAKTIMALIAEVEHLRKDAARYRWLRERDLETIRQGGVFAGMTPENIVLNQEDLYAPAFATRTECTSVVAHMEIRT
ncbi:TPA: hypothetical protein SMO30_004773 [Pseudomonas aeruginosa]|nr:hypothetical protein [Pseudomonas aeruginosa]